MFPSTLILGMAFSLSILTSFAQDADTTAVRYMLEVVENEARQPGLIRYEIHVLLPDSDRVSAVYGTNTYPL